MNLDEVPLSNVRAALLIVGRCSLAIYLHLELELELTYFRG